MDIIWFCSRPILSADCFGELFWFCESGALFSTSVVPICPVCLKSVQEGPSMMCCFGTLTFEFSKLVKPGFDCQQVGGTCKFFTYVAKIEKKTGEFQWRHYFWNCYCKEVIPNQLKIFATVKTKHYLFFRYDVNKNKGNGQNICEKVKFDKDFNWLGMTFLQYKSQK